jgi:hypothetical protein
MLKYMISEKRILLQTMDDLRLNPLHEIVPITFRVICR